MVKRMAKYIDRKAVLSMLIANNAPGKAYEKIAALPVAAVQLVKHGWWNGYETCSVCGASKSYFFYCTETGDWDGDWNYCPNCGAKMDANELEKEMSKIAEMEMAYGEYLND